MAEHSSTSEVAAPSELMVNQKLENAEKPPASPRSRVSLKLAAGQKWLVDNHLLVFLAIAFVIGLSWPEPGQAVSEPKVKLGSLGELRLVQSMDIIIIFLISGFRLKTDALLGVLRSPMALLVASFLILILTPCLGFGASKLPLEPREFSYGLALFCCVPTTLTSGAALIAGCEGASRATELALLVTVATNMLGSITTPIGVSLVLQAADVSIDTGLLLAKLTLLLLVPTFVGKLVQYLPGGAAFAKKHKVPLTVFSNFNLVFIVWQSVSRAQGHIVSQPVERMLACIACAVVLHLVLWVVNTPVLFVSKFQDIHHRRAIFLLSAQKTLPVSLAIITGLPESSGQAGLLALPCIFGHLAQLVMDSFLVDFWAKRPYPLAKDPTAEQNTSTSPEAFTEKETANSTPV